MDQATVLSNGGSVGGRKECFPPVPHKLVGSYIHKAHRFSSTCQSKEAVLKELEALFNLNAESGGEEEGTQVAGEIGWMVLSEIWRTGGLPSSRSQDHELEEEEVEGTGRCLRELVGGEIGALINILLEEETDQGSDWVFERVEVDRNGRSVQGIDALRIGWRRWEGVKGVYEIEQNGLEDNDEEGDGLVFDGFSQPRENGAESWTSSGESTRIETQNGSATTNCQPNGLAANGREAWGNPETGGWNDEW